MELKSKIRQLIEMSSLDYDEQISLDDFAYKVTYLNDLLTYDVDYDIEVYFQNYIGVNDEEESREDKELYYKTKHYGIEMLKRFGISVNNEIEVTQFRSLIDSLVDLINMESDTAIEILEFLETNSYNTDKDNLINILDEYTGVERDVLETFIESASSKIFTFLGNPVEETEDVKFDITLLNKLEFIDKNLLHATILKSLLGLGKLRLPDTINYTQYLKKCKNPNLNMLGMNICLIFMHVNKDCIISYDSMDSSKPTYYINRIREFHLDELIEENISLDNAVKFIGEMTKKIQGIKL